MVCHVIGADSEPGAVVHKTFFPIKQKKPNTIHGLGLEDLESFGRRVDIQRLDASV